MTIPSKLYDILKWVTMVVLPASSILYVALANVWQWPYAPEISATLAAVAAFLGTVLQISSANYRTEQAEKKAEAKE